jgi:hypothetical protein
MSRPRFVRRTPLAGLPVGREFSVNWGDQSLVREVRLWFGHNGDWFDAIQVIWRSDDGALLRSPVLGPARQTALGEPTRHDAAIVLDEGAVMNGLHGRLGSGDRVTAIGVITDTETLPLLGDDVGKSFRWELVEFPEDTYPGALITGMFGHFDRMGLRGIGLRCTVDGEGPRLIPTGTGGRVVPVTEAGKLPRIDETRVPASPSELLSNASRIDHIGEPTPEAIRPNPNHVRVDVRRVDQWDDTLRIHALNGAVQPFRYVRRRPVGDDSHMVDIYDGDATAAVHFYAGNVWIEVSPGAPGLTRPVPPPPAAPDGPTWDNVFSLDHRVDYLAWALRGLDISRLAPFNLQESLSALQEEVFAKPAPGSRDFHIATNGKATVVPNGWQFVGDVAGSNKARTTSSFSDEESRKTWSTSLGISAEADALGAKVAYKNNSNAHGAVSGGSSGKIVSTIVETMELSHSLVVDLATVELAPGFRNAVEDLARDMRNTRIEAFIHRFGTHFAYAVTFGSKSWEQKHETEQSVSHSATTGSSQDQSIEAGYHGEVGGASGSVSWGSAGESSNSAKKGTGSSVSSSGSVGSATEPVPIMLEVEELTHLLSPVFFPDPYIHVDVRKAVDLFLEEFPTEFEYSDSSRSLSFEVYPPRTPGPGRAGREGQTLQDENLRYWRIRGGKRHIIPSTAPNLEFLIGREYVFKVTNQELERFQDSGEAATSEGLLKRADHSAKQVWWISGGKRHVVPSETVVDVLGGWDLVGVHADVLDYEVAGAPTSIEGKMIKLAEEDITDLADAGVWVISNRQRHRIPIESGISSRGGWRHVAVVRKSVFEAFPDSGEPAV